MIWPIAEAVRGAYRSRMTDRRRMAEQLAEIAVEASRAILPFWRAGGEVGRKTDGSPVTEADRASEAVILPRLAQQWPELPVFSEECFEDGHCPVPGDRFFSVDPLDGTKGFVQGKDCFAVCIGLVEHGRPAIGAVAGPALGRVWWTDGQAVFRRGFDQTGAERVSPRERPADGGLALVSNSLSDAKAEALARQYGCPHWEGMDSALKFCLLADGAADVYPRNGPTMEWDTCAGEALVVAAGGRMADLDGNPMTYGRVDRRLLNPGFVAWARA